MKLVVYEDRISDFCPIFNLYPQYDLRIGGRSVREHLGSHLTHHTIEVLRERFSAPPQLKIDGPAVYLSARVILSTLPVIPPNECAFTCNGVVVGMVKHKPPYPATIAEIMRNSTQAKHRQDLTGHVMHRIWDCIRLNPWATEIHADSLKVTRTLPKGVVVIGKRKHIYTRPGAVIHRGVVLDVSNGPIIIDAHACVRPYSTIAGPSYIGPGTIVDRARITASSIGPMCRIGGEVEACVFQGYANKYHEGFIGHSYIGEWVNLGALTTNSDLKNNYGNVRVMIRGILQDTGLTKLGCFIGDHSKTRIGTLIPTGAVVGSFVNFAGNGLMPRFVKDFTWLTGAKKEIYTLEKALETARVVMGRRGHVMTREYQQAIEECYSWRNS